MNIAFFGTSDKSKPILEALKKSKFDLKLCVTKQDVKVGRHQKTKTTAVKEWAVENRVQFITIPRFTPESKTNVLNALKTNNIELIVVVDFSFIIPKEIFDYPKHKTINIHFSLLPNYRGASPVQFAILNGENKTGITYLLMSEGMDEGEIVYQSEYKLTGNETAEILYETLFEKASNEIEKVIEKYLNQKYVPKPQDESKATYTYSPSHPKSTLIYKEDAKINWGKSPQEIDNMVRAFNPWPIAWTTLKDVNKNFAPIKSNKDLNKRVKIYETNIQNGELKIKKLKVEGKQKISWEDFKNGYLTNE